VSRRLGPWASVASGLTLIAGVVAWATVEAVRVDAAGQPGDLGVLAPVLLAVGAGLLIDGGVRRWATIPGRVAVALGLAVGLTVVQLMVGSATS
jgi:hypothetical protein